jgi:hypothetical protein
MNKVLTAGTKASQGSNRMMEVIRSVRLAGVLSVSRVVYQGWQGVFFSMGCTG